MKQFQPVRPHPIQVILFDARVEEDQPYPGPLGAILARCVCQSMASNPDESDTIIWNPSFEPSRCSTARLERMNQIILERDIKVARLEKRLAECIAQSPTLQGYPEYFELLGANYLRQALPQCHTRPLGPWNSCPPITRRKGL
jgi:hypothetical protein